MVRRGFSLHPQDGHRCHSSLLCGIVVLLSAEQWTTRAEAKLEDAKPSSHPTTGQETEDTSLSAKLSAHRRESGNRLPAFAKAYDELVERLHVLDQGQVGPKLGEPMPHFCLPDDSGHLISLSSLLK